MWPILLSALIIILSLIFYEFTTSKPTKNSPPGPWRFPIVGSYLTIFFQDRFTFKTLAKLSERYNNPVLGMYLGDFYFIIANSYESCKEVLNHLELQTRPDAFPFRARAFGKRLGLFFDDGPEWLLRKRTSFRTLRDFGLGRRHEDFETVIEEEARDLLESVKEEVQDGGSVTVPAIFQPMMANMVLQLLMGKRFTKQEYERFKKLNLNQIKNLRAIDPTGGLITFQPWFRYFVPKTVGYADFMESSTDLANFMKELIEENAKDYQEGVTRGLMDALVHNSKENADLTDEQILLMCVDLIIPSNTQSQVLTFALMHLIEHPEIQEQCQQQIDDVIGRARFVNLNDREDLSLIEATLREVFRLEPSLPLLVPHLAQEDTTFMTYDVPKFTTFLPNVYAAHRDKTVWEDPDNFRPHRFLNKKGKFDPSKDYTLAFGKGKRVCPGETFTRQNLFVALTTILQNFTIEEDTPINWNEIVSGPVITAPDGFRVRLIPRS